MPGSFTHCPLTKLGKFTGFLYQCFVANSKYRTCFGTKHRNDRGLRKKTNNRYPSDGSEILARKSNLINNRIGAGDRLIKFVLCLHKKL